MDSKINPMSILLQCLDIFIENKHWPELKPSQIFNIILYSHNKGWVYTPTVNGEIKCVFCAYRIPEVNEKTLLKIPDKEHGTILYIPFFLSLNKEENLFKLVRESLRIYIENNPDITEMVLQDKNESIKRYSLNKKNTGEVYEVEENGITSNANV